VRFLAFVGHMGIDKHLIAGWNDAFGGGDDLEQLVVEATAGAQQLLDSFTASEVRFYVKAWWHVVDLEQGAIVREGGFHDDTCATISPEGWLVRHRK
jgi:hypothetical protein